MDNTDKTLAILQGSHDGDDLAPEHLKLVEWAANNCLNERGWSAIDELYASVSQGTYRKPAYLDVKFMTRDHDGFVYFKDTQVEHYSNFWAYTLDAKASLTKLQHQCLFLEGIGELTAFPYMLCDYGMKGKFGEAFVQHEKEALDRRIGGDGICFSLVTVGTDKTPEKFMLPGHVSPAMVQDSAEYRDMLKFGRADNPHRITITAYSYGGAKERPAAKEELDCLNCCMDYLNDQELLKAQETASFDLTPEQEDEFER